MEEEGYFPLDFESVREFDIDHLVEFCVRERVDRIKLSGFKIPTGNEGQ